ncbi:MAG: type II CRISPR-associated endonuclease Cas1 [Verrucomicrobiota bacterium]
MSDPFIVIQSDGVFVRQHRGFLEIQLKRDSGQETRRFPFDSIEGVLVESKGVSLTKSAITALAEKGIPLIFTDRNHQPEAALVSFKGHHRASEMLNAQSDAKLPLKKNIWKLIIQAKIQNQHLVLNETHEDTTLQHLAGRVRSGDSDNREGVAARLYWSRLFGSGFTRNPDSPDLNALLNFGYAIVRSAMAKEAAIHGLHPALGVHHRNARNAFRLIDDLMEPFRPAVDYVVFCALDEGHTQVTNHTKHLMLQLCYEPIFRNKEWGRSLNGAIRLCVRSYVAKMLDNTRVFVACPDGLMPAIFALGRRGVLTR